MKIKLFQPHIGIEEKNAIQKTLESKFWASGQGVGNVEKFEKKFKEYVDSDLCIAVNSGTAALNLAISLLEIKNKEVILPSLSFVSTANAVLLNGGIPIFTEINERTLCLDPPSIEKSITRKTKLILPVHFGGYPSNLNEIKKIARKHDCQVIEDAAHAVGSKYDDKKIGKHNFASCFSFHPVKNLAMPTGGLISINHPNYKSLEKKLKSLRWCGITNRKSTIYDVKELGNNYYMNEFSAALGLVQLKKIDKLTKIRQKIAKRYFNELEIDLKMPFDKNCSYHLYWIRVKNRKKLQKTLKQSGIETGNHYQPIHQFSLYRKNISLPITEKIANEIITIPIHPNLTNNQITQIIKIINKN
ncbi:MAG: glutamine--scyllo-inositol aminotransferase [Chloroflexi bacterium]|nr:glutamine--scyllo-inositol aminotransferase [Chloroflexota bacterium]|tara:strand:+ start:29770 stop:30846 length:1077 start_codon:yes stop_codon:yes gene_type:complete